MEKELNIAAILKDKPLYTKLWSDTFGDVFLTECLVDSFSVEGRDDNLIWTYLPNGTFKKYMGVLSIFPSYEMRDWRKFAWKKGDVLVLNGECGIVHCIFEAFENDEYTLFKSRFACSDESHNNWLQFNTQSFTKSYEKASDDEAKEFIKKVEEHYEGKLNLSTLQIEQPKKEFKDGDIVTAKFYDDGTEMICIFKEKYEEFYMGHCGVFSTGKFKGKVILSFGEDCIGEDNECHLRYATDSEKQQLFDALAKENKAWDADTLQIENLQKKCELKAFDFVLVNDRGKDSLWFMYQFAFKFNRKGYEYYCMIGGRILEVNLYNILPYNDQTAHLLGTTDEWKGGEL